jgi:hypothetical protein
MSVIDRDPILDLVTVDQRYLVDQLAPDASVRECCHAVARDPRVKITTRVQVLLALLKAGHEPRRRKDDTERLARAWDVAMRARLRQAPQIAASASAEDGEANQRGS